MTSIQSDISELDHILSWHPAINSYILDNGDVLLLSEQKEILLPSTEYPFLSFINGTVSANQIIHKISGQALKIAQLILNIKRLLESQLLVSKKAHTNYRKTLFSETGNDYLEYSGSKNGINIISLSALSIQVIQQSLPVLHEKTSCNETTLNKDLVIIFVDDFLDPRISLYFNDTIEQSLIIIKLSGAELWVSPLYNTNEYDEFIYLQNRILDNQPVRKYFQLKMPNHQHHFAIDCQKLLTENALSTLSDSFEQQLYHKKTKKLIIYDKVKKTVISHPHPQAIHAHQGRKYFGEALTLSNTIAPFCADGGSRTLSAQHTVDNLSQLISPVTGIITHLETVNQDSTSPIKVYRSAFFKVPNHLSTSNFTRNTFVQICMGKGVDNAQSQASAIGEVIERYNSIYNNTVPLTLYSESELKHCGIRYYNFHELAAYSSQQYLHFQNIQQLKHNGEQRALPYNNSKIHWLPCWSLSQHQQVFIPLCLCLSNTPFTEEQFGRWQSNGCAAGNTIEEAILQALLELIERDASAIWWYNKIVRPQFDLSRLDSNHMKKIHRAIAVNQQDSYNYWVLDLTNDVGVPVMVAIGRSPKTEKWIMGFGCHLIPELAAQRALTELCQLIPVREHNSAPFDFDEIVESPHLYPATSQNQQTPPYSIAHNGNLKKDIENIVSQLQLLGFETIALDTSNKDIPLNTVKVFVPGLCHIWPQLGNQRLYQTPIKLGWLTTKLTEDSINTLALYI